uniref:Cadherin domain-containing protein n=1 Tax=Anopheles coluzzii TaxID=1518534 RepID=A0A8W7PF20_ANOCL
MYCAPLCCVAPPGSLDRSQCNRQRAIAEQPNTNPLHCKESFRFNLIYQSSTLFFLALIPPDTEQIRVNVLDKNDSPPKFQNLPLVFSVSEDLAVGQTVARITATDPDTLGKLEYALLDGDAPKKFALERETGLLKLRDTLDRETEDSYRLKVSVTDGIQSTETTITIQTLEFHTASDHPVIADPFCP